jgi:hypothetical protein
VLFRHSVGDAEEKHETGDGVFLAENGADIVRNVGCYRCAELLRYDLVTVVTGGEGEVKLP